MTFKEFLSRELPQKPAKIFSIEKPKMVLNAKPNFSIQKSLNSPFDSIQKRKWDTSFKNRFKMRAKTSLA